MPPEKMRGSARKASAAKVALGSGAEGTAFHVSVEGGKIVLDPLVGGALGDSVTLEDVLLAGDSDEANSYGFIVGAEVVTQAKADKVTVFKKKSRHNYRRKHGPRQQLTILKIVAVGDRKSVKKALTESKGAASGNQTDEPPELLDASTLEESRELKSLAADLNAAADRMKDHLDHAIEAVRASLDPERETAARERYEAEFAGSGDLLLAGLR